VLFPQLPVSDGPSRCVPHAPEPGGRGYLRRARPAILKMLGHNNLFRRTVQARLEKGIEKRAGIRHFVRARIRRDGEGYAVGATGEHGSGILKPMVRADGLIILPEEAATVRQGDTVTVQLRDDSLERLPTPRF